MIPRSLSKHLPAREALWLGALLAVAAAFRYSGVHWDESQGLHPDERFLVMVVDSLRWTGFASFFDTAHSGWNPHNNGAGLFVYGTFPVFLVRLVCNLLRALAYPVDTYVVARIVTASFDLGTVVLCFFLGRRLGGAWCGRLAAALYALAVVPIQLAHFFAVDPFAAFFATALVLLALVLETAEPGRSFRRTLALFGVTYGLAISSKLSIFPVALALPAALWMRATAQGKRHGERVFRILVPSFYAAATAFLVFRIAQPYAFAGPGFFGLRGSPRWLKNLEELEQLSRAVLGFPPNTQWIGRAPWFPLEQMLLWGLGPFVVVGALCAAVVLLRRHLRSGFDGTALLYGYAALNFVLFGALSGTKYLRYQLPLYGCTVVLFALLCTNLLRRNDRARIGGAVLAGISLVYGLGASLAFHSIYDAPVTRIEASRWILRHWPGPMNLEIDRGSDHEVEPIAALGRAIPEFVSYNVRRAGTLRGFSLHRMRGHDLPYPPAPALSKRRAVSATPPPLQLYLSVRRAGSTLLESTMTLEVPPSNSTLGTQRWDLGPLPVLAGDTVELSFDNIPPARAVEIEGTRIVHETAWDDMVPLRVDGYDPFGGIYEGDQKIEMYDIDDGDKEARLLNMMAVADVFHVTSNRQYATLTRLPDTFPTTIRFYRALFRCEAPRTIERCAREATPETAHVTPFGLRLEKVFARAPKLFGFPIDDQGAEESFTVYDHPRVLLFRRVAPFDRATAQAALRRSEAP